MRILTASILACCIALMATSAPAAPGPVAHWRGDGDAQDAVGSSHGSLNGVGFAPGQIGQAFDFRSTNSFVEVPESPAIDLPNGSSWSLSAWSFRTSASSPLHLVGKRSGCGGGDGFYQLAVGNGAIPPASLPLDAWAHAAITYDAATSTFRNYVDGVVVFVNGPIGWNIDNAAALRIGTSSSCAVFDGLLDDVRLYNRALSGVEVAQLAGTALPSFTRWGLGALIAFLLAALVLLARRPS